MAFVNSTSYDGQNRTDWFAKTLYGAKSLNYFSPLLNVNGKVKIPQLAVGSILQAAACDWNASGDVTLSEKTITPCDVMVNVTLCVDDLTTHFESEYLRGNAQGQTIPADLNAFILDQMGKKIANDLEVGIWAGFAGCSGLTTLLSGDSSVVDVTATTGTVNSSTIIAELNRIYDAIDPLIVTDTDNLKIFVPIAWIGYYKQAVAAASAESYYTKDAPLTFLGIELVGTPGLSGKKAVCTTKENLWFATNLMSDWNYLKVLNMSELDGSANVRFSARMRFSVDFKFGEFIVFYN